MRKPLGEPGMKGSHARRSPAESAGGGRNTPLDMRSPDIKNVHFKTRDGMAPDQNSPDIAAKFR